MKYFVIEGMFLDGHPTGAAMEEAMKAHLEYFRAGFKSGAILFSGPKQNGRGGVVVVKCKDTDDLQDFIAKDPFVTAGIQTYRVTEFALYDCQEPLRYWFDQ